MVNMENILDNQNKQSLFFMLDSVSLFNELFENYFKECNQSKSEYKINDLNMKNLVNKYKDFTFNYNNKEINVVDMYLKSLKI